MDTLFRRLHGSDFNRENGYGFGAFELAQGPVVGGSIAGAAQAGRAAVESGYTPQGYDPVAAALEEAQTRRDGGAMPVASDPVVTGEAVGSAEELEAARRRSEAQGREAAARAAGDLVAARYWAEQYDPVRARTDYPDAMVRTALLSRDTSAPVEWLREGWDSVVREAAARRDGDTAAARYWAEQTDPARARRDYPDAVVRNYLSRLPTSAPLEWARTFLPPGTSPVGLLPGQTPAQWEQARGGAIAEDREERARRQAAADAADPTSRLPEPLRTIARLGRGLVGDTFGENTGLLGQLLGTGQQSLVGQLLGGAGSMLGGGSAADLLARAQQAELGARQVADSILSGVNPDLQAIRAQLAEDAARVQATAEHRLLTEQEAFRREVMTRLDQMLWMVQQGQGPQRW